MEASALQLFPGEDEERFVPMEKIYQIAVVGCGDISETGHFPSFQANERIRVAAISDIDPLRMAKMAAAYHVPATSIRYQDVIEREDIDAVFVLTPPHMTPIIALCGLEAGKDVFCEKPLALDADIVFKIRETEEKTGRLLQVGFKNIRSPLMEKLKAWIDEGRFGSPVVYRISVFDEASNESNAQFNEKVDSVLRQGSPLIHEGAHLADFIRFFTDGAEPVRVMAMGLKSKPGYPRSNYTSSLVELSNGDVAQLEAAWLYPEFFPGVIDVMGDLGVARLERANRSLIYRNGVAEEIVRMEENWNTICFQRQLAYFIECLDNRRTPVPGSREGLMSIEFTNRLEQSLLTGKIC